MKRKVYTDGNGGSSVLIEGLGAYVPKSELESLKAQIEQLEQLLVLSTDQNDLLLDEFVRVKLLTNNTEIHALCERAHVRMRQNVSVIDRNIMQEQKIISQKRDIKEMQCHIELLQSFLMQCKYRNPEMPMPDFIRTGQCLAEIKAQGIMEALGYAQEKCSTYLDVDFYVMEYADQLRQQGDKK